VLVKCSLAPLVVGIEGNSARREVERKRLPTTDGSGRRRSPLAPSSSGVGRLLRLFTRAGKVVIFLSWRRSFGGWNFTVFSWWRDATSPLLVEDQHGRTSLESRVSALTGPVPVARLPQRHVTVGVIFAKRMFLTASHVLRPVAGVGLLVVEQSSDTELLGGGPVPAGPVASAGGLVTEDPVEPVAVLRALGGISSFSLIAVDIVGIVAGSKEAEGSSSVVHQSVRTGLDEALVPETFVVEVALTLVGHVLGSRPTSVRSAGARAALLGSSEIIFEIVRILVPLGDYWGPGAGRWVQGGERDGLEGVPVQGVAQLIVVVHIVGRVFINVGAPPVFCEILCFR